MLRVYVSGPMTNGGGPIQWDNVYRAMDCANILIRLGYAPICPALTAYQGSRGQDITHDQWLAVDREWVRVAQAVVRLSGPSVGADQECAWADDMGVKVYQGLGEFLLRHDITKRGLEWAYGEIVAAQVRKIDQLPTPKGVDLEAIPTLPAGVVF